jgi:hypothetical protein
MRPPSYLLETISRQFFMPFCGTTFDENSVPPLDKGGLQGLNAATNPPRSCATAVAAAPLLRRRGF